MGNKPRAAFVVEDKQADLDWIIPELTSRGYAEPWVARTRQEALERGRKLLHTSLLVVDVRLPEDDPRSEGTVDSGIALAGELAQSVRFRDVPAIVVTAYDADPAAEEIAQTLRQGHRAVGVASKAVRGQFGAVLDGITPAAPRTVWAVGPPPVCTACRDRLATVGCEVTCATTLSQARIQKAVTPKPIAAVVDLTTPEEERWAPRPGKCVELAMRIRADPMCPDALILLYHEESELPAQGRWPAMRGSALDSELLPLMAGLVWGERL